MRDRTTSYLICRSIVEASLESFTEIVDVWKQENFFFYKEEL